MSRKPTNRPSSPRRKRGAQPGNINAIRSGRYAIAFWGKFLPTAEEVAILDEASEIPADDLSGEIAILRQRLALLLQYQPAAVELLARVVVVLAATAKAHYSLSNHEENELITGMTNILNEYKATLNLGGGVGLEVSL